MPDTQIVAELMRGPRGRRALLEFAVASEERFQGAGRWDGSLSQGVFFASYQLDPGKDASVTIIGSGLNDAEATMLPLTPADVAARLSTVALAPVTPERLRSCVSQAVDAARYWQEPDGTDVLAAAPELHESLSRVAEHLSGSADLACWAQPLAQGNQWQLAWDDDPLEVTQTRPRQELRAGTALIRAEERRAVRECPADVTFPLSGDWWSTPPGDVHATTGVTVDGSPAGLWCVEDSCGIERAVARRLGVPAGLRTCEINSGDAWAELCVRFPLDVTAQKRHDWYRTTGRDGAWVVPDWAAVAEVWDAVHLQPLAYLSAAGRAIRVDGQRSSVIAGWVPDRSYWFTDRVRYVDAATTWEMQERGDTWLWTQTS